MKRIILLTIAILVLLSCICIESVLSFSGATHRILSYYAVSNSVLNKENYLVNYLGFQNGLQEPLKWEGKSQTVSLWMQDGSDLEDGTMWDYLILKGRSFNHFHNPLKEWGAAGLNDIFTGESSLLWAQDGSNQSTFPGGDWSWRKTRDLYYAALTTATDEGRQQYFAMTFRGLGHQMHLIEDMAVPEHARNDAHPEQTFPGYNDGVLYFEPWAAKYGAFISQLAQNPLPATVSLNTKINNYVPITQFTDTNQYDGSNPSTSTVIGLSEYTNANFFSDDTIFAAEEYSPGHPHYFPYPKKSDTDLQDYINQGKLPEIITAWDGVDDLGFWIAKKAGNEIEIGHFLKPTYHSNDVQPLPGTEQIYYRTFYRDEVCHADYASALVPRAVGYSAGLLDYFFRGKIEITEPLAVGGSISLLAKNVTKGEEEMPDGDIKLVARYSIKDDTTNAIYYQVADTETNTSSIPKDDPIELSFPITIPENAKDITLQVVYKGELGQEENAVAVGLMPYIPKPVIILYKNLGTEQEPRYDWWYYVVDENKGVHKDPQVSFPSNPEIISKWWSCDGMEEVEYFTRVSPAFKFIGTGGCGDSCGLTSFKDQYCCSGSSAAPNDSKSWGTCPCGGDWKQGAYGWYCGIGPFACDGGTNIGDPFRESRALAGCGNNYNRMSNASRPCPKGESWGLAVGDLTEKMDVGPRSRTSGYESRTTCNVESAVCGPYPYSKRCCNSWKDTWEDPCRAVGGDTWLGCCGKWDPYSCGTECKAGYNECTNWFVRGSGGSGPAAWRWSGYNEFGGPVNGGCLVFTSESKSAGYSTESVPLKTRVKVGDVETLFEGSWSQYTSSPGTANSERRRDGFANSCQPCQVGTLGSSSYSHASYSYSEQSYGVGGWRTVVASDGKFAVLIPKMNLSASATSTDGSASGGISSTTTALLRIVDGSGVDFDLAQADINYALNGMPGSRDDLGIKPNCWPRDLPLDIELRGLHWFSDDAFLVTFMLKDKFYAHLFKKQNGAWSGLQLVSFEEWVNNNELNDHLMFLK